MTRLLIYLLFCFASQPAWGAVPLEEEIRQLLAAVSTSGCQFVRNGKSHSPAESVKHISRKYEHFRDEIDSLNRFIELTATRSLITGREYQVSCDGVMESSADWLQGKARELELSS